MNCFIYVLFQKNRRDEDEDDDDDEDDGYAEEYSKSKVWEKHVHDVIKSTRFLVRSPKIKFLTFISFLHWFSFFYYVEGQGQANFCLSKFQYENKIISWTKSIQ